jgi:HEAT repeat-containing protein 5
MGAGQHMTSSISILFALAQNSSSAIVQVWAIHALYLIVDSGGSMFRNYIEPCVEHIFQSVLNIPHTNRDVFVGLGKLLGSLITFMGPELQIDTPSNNDMRLACLTTCTVMQIHSDSMIRAESIQCLQQLHLFASKHVSLPNLVPYLLENILSKEFLLRKVAVSCLRQLCQKDSLEVCRITVDYVQETKPLGLLSLINEQRGLECLLFKLLDIEVNPFLIRDIHDILNSLLCSSLNEKTLKRWIFLLKDIAISAEESSSNNNQSTEDKKTSIRKVKKKQNDKEEDEEEDDTELYDDSQSFQTQSNNDPLSNVMRSPSVSSNLNNSIVNNANIIRMKQITKIIAPKWPNRVFSVELIRRIMCMCVSLSDETIKNNIIFSNQIQQPHIQLQEHQNNSNKNDTNPHFSLLLARKLKQKQQQKKSSLLMNEDDYLILFLQDLMRIACIAATSNCDPLKLAGLDLLNDLIFYFGQVEEPNPEFKGHLILEQYQAQVSACLRAQFSFETSAHVVSKACQVCSMWISSGVARDLNDLRRVHQLLVSSLQKLTNNNNNNQSTNPIKTSTNNENLIYSELSLTVEKLAVLRAWAEVYIVAQNRRKQNDSLSSTESLLNLVQPELSLLSYHWSIALKDYAFLSLPNDYASQLPIEGGAFYHADLVESSRPVYKEHFTKILLAYSIWLNEIQFNIEEMSTNQAISDDKKEKLFFMLLGLSLEHLSNTTGLAKLNDETIEHILESIINLLNTSVAKQLLLNKKCSLCVEILSILYKVKLTRDVMNINLLVIKIVKEINQLRCVVSNDEDKADTTSKAKVNSAVTSLIYVQLEICIRDLIKYLPNLLVTSSDQQQLNRAKTSFLHMNSTACKALNLNDVELIKCVLNVLNDLPFQIEITVESIV